MGKCRPFEILCGRAPPSLARFVPMEMVMETVTQDFMIRDEALKRLKFHLGRAQGQMVKFANHHRLK